MPEQPARRARPHRPTDLPQLMALAQGLYYLVTGIWPLVSLGTFQKVTGPKADDWLVKTAGVLITAIGLVLTRAGLRERVPDEVPLLAVSSAVGLTGIDVVYATRGRISPVYLLDALAELLLVAGWAVAWPARRDRDSPPTG